MPHSVDIPVPINANTNIEHQTVTTGIFATSTFETIPDRDDFTYEPEPSCSNKQVQIDQQLLDRMVAYFNMSQRHAEKLASFLKEGNNLEPGIKITGYRKRQSEYQKFFSVNDDNTFTYCNDIDGLMNAMQIKYKSNDWRLFIDSSKFSLKVVLLHKTNEKPSIPIGYSTDMKETYDSMKTILQKVDYERHQWKISCDLKVVALLSGLQLGYVKYMCFICDWNTRYKGNQYEKDDWIDRNEHQIQDKNIIHDPLVPTNKILLPPLHIKLGIVKNFIKAVVKREQVFNCLRTIFPKLSIAKIREGRHHKIFKK